MAALTAAGISVFSPYAQTPDGSKTREARPVITHAAVGARVVVSSTHTGNEDEGDPRCLVDGKLHTRWSSEYRSPQYVEVYFPRRISLHELRLHWEQACAARYFVSVSADGTSWTTAHFYLNKSARTEPRLDRIPLKDTPAAAIRLDLLASVNTNWGFSLYEIEVVPSR